MRLALIFLLLSSIWATAAELSCVTLHLDGRDVPVSSAQKTVLVEQALGILETSNSHSLVEPNGKPPSNRNTANSFQGIKAKSCLTIRFAKPITVNSVGGPVIVQELLIGLVRDDMASGLFSVNGTKEISIHSMYDGMKCMELRKMVAAIVAK